MTRISFTQDLTECAHFRSCDTVGDRASEIGILIAGGEDAPREVGAPPALRVNAMAGGTVDAEHTVANAGGVVLPKADVARTCQEHRDL